MVNIDFVHQKMSKLLPAPEQNRKVKTLFRKTNLRPLTSKTFPRLKNDNRDLNEGN